MLDAAVYGLLVVFPLIAALMRRWLAVALPLLGWPIFYLGVNKRWWGYGVGDGWQYGAVSVTLIGVVTTALAVAIARSLKPPPRFAKRFVKPS